MTRACPAPRTAPRPVLPRRSTSVFAILGSTREDGICARPALQATRAPPKHNSFRAPLAPGVILPGSTKRTLRAGMPVPTARLVRGRPGAACSTRGSASSVRSARMGQVPARPRLPGAARVLPAAPRSPGPHHRVTVRVTGTSMARPGSSAGPVPRTARVSWAPPMCWVVCVRQTATALTSSRSALPVHRTAPRRRGLGVKRRACVCRGGTGPTEARASCALRCGRAPVGTCPFHTSSRVIWFPSGCAVM